MHTERGTYVTIDMNAIAHNISTVRSIIGPGGKILLPVKADAYGHGAVAVSRFVQEAGIVQYLGVASIEEGVELRENGIGLPILILGFIIPTQDNLERAIGNRLTISVGSLEILERIGTFCEERKRNAAVHIKIDTGMGRLGVSIRDAYSLIRSAHLMKNITVDGIFSHMPVADDTSHPFNVVQISTFRDLIDEVLPLFSGNRPIIHLANSGAIMHYPYTVYDMVRPGIMSYGYRPSPYLHTSIDIRPSMSLFSQIQFTKKVPDGTPLSYGHTYRTEGDCYVSTVSCGYGDGYFRCLSNRAHCRIDGRYYPLAGRICMDLLLVNTGSTRIPEGTAVELFGTTGITADTLATLADTISYEITCSIQKRVPRIYL